MKPIKVLVNGKRMKDIYPYATKWQVFKFKVRKFVRSCVVALFLIAVIAVCAVIIRNSFPKTVYLSKNVDISNEVYNRKIEDLKDTVVAKLASCESAGYSESDGIIIFDSNAKASIGQLQFQKTTVIHYYKTLYGKTITAKEAVLIALDTEKASQLAKDVIFTTKNKVSGDWYNCSKKFNLDAQVDLIKQLQ